MKKEDEDGHRPPGIRGLQSQGHPGAWGCAASSEDKVTDSIY